MFYLKKKKYIYICNRNTLGKKSDFPIDYLQKTEIIAHHQNFIFSMIQMNLFTHRSRPTDRENKLLVSKGNGSGERDKLGV